MRLPFLFFTIVSTVSLAGPGGVKSVFLNGVDISSARSQELKNVDVIINEQGEIFLLAPHYQVNEEDTYVPLSKYAQGLGPISHKPPKAVRSPVKKDDNQDSRSSEKPKSGTSVKNDADQSKASPPQSGSDESQAAEAKATANDIQNSSQTPTSDPEGKDKPKESTEDKTEDSSSDSGAAVPY
jgi:type IV secretory pathway VirB10-like protein